MREFGSAEELKGAVGTVLGRSRIQRIDQSLVNGFADVSGDHQWIHVDVEKAATGPYGATIVHGLLTVAISQHLAHEVWDVQPRKSGALYGFNNLRFPAPLPVPADISVIVELLEVDDTREYCKVTSLVTTEAIGIDKPVCVGQPVIIFNF